MGKIARDAKAIDAFSSNFLKEEVGSIPLPYVNRRSINGISWRPVFSAKAEKWLFSKKVFLSKK